MLAWFLDWGEHVEFLEGLAADGREPKALRDRPALHAHLIGWWNAFAELSGDRPVHFGGVRPIPFTAIDRWAARYGIDDPDGFDAFRTAVRAMDAVFLRHAAGKNEAKGG